MTAYLFGYKVYGALEDEEGRALMVDAVELDLNRPQAKINDKKVLDAMSDAQSAYEWGRAAAPKPKPWKVVTP